MRIVGIRYAYFEGQPEGQPKRKADETTIPAADEAYIECEGGKDGPIRFKLEMRRGKLLVTAASSVGLSLRPLSQHEIIVGESGSKQFHPHQVECPVCGDMVEARHGLLRTHGGSRNLTWVTCEGSGRRVDDLKPFAALDMMTHEEPQDG